MNISTFLYLYFQLHTQQHPHTHICSQYIVEWTTNTALDFKEYYPLPSYQQKEDDITQLGMDDLIIWCKRWNQTVSKSLPFMNSKIVH